MKITLIHEYLQKLKSKKGSAMLLSLLFSVVSLIIASVILNAATTSSRRVAETAESRQPYYLVTSLFGVFDYEATSPKKDDTANPKVYPAGGMEFTVDLNYDSTQSVKYNARAFVLETQAATASDALRNKTNLESLTNHVAYCLAEAMLSGNDASRGFTVTAGGALTGDASGKTYEISGTVSVNAVDYSVQITVTAITDVTVSGSPESLGLPEICTLILPTEKVEIQRMETVNLVERPTKIRFTYQRAEYSLASG